MKLNHFLLILILFIAPNLFGKDIVYQFNINSEISSSTWLYTQKAIKQAEENNSSLFIIELNTYGGEVIYADSIRTAILNCQIPTIAYIYNNAASAGALISLACDKIYMVSSATMGATTVVNGANGEKTPDKYQSYMRATMRATAESHGKDSTTGKWHRDPIIAEAMVDENNSVDSGRILTLTANEAIQHNYCEGIVSNISDILKLEGIDPSSTTITVYEPSGIDKIKGSLLGTALRSILIMLIFGGIFYELKTPGIGFPLAIAVIAALLYFAPLYLDGLAAHWEIIIFFIGIILIVLELFLFPGFGICGISGIILVIVGLTLSLISNDITFNFNTFEFSNINSNSIGHAAATVLFGIIGSVILMFFISSRIGAGGIFSRLSLQKEQTIEDGYISVSTYDDNLIGQHVTTISDLRPSGKIEFNGKRYDAISLNGYIEKNNTAKIVKTENGNLYVETLEYDK